MPPDRDPRKKKKKQELYENGECGEALSTRRFVENFIEIATLYSALVRAKRGRRLRAPSAWSEKRGKKGNNQRFGYLDKSARPFACVFVQRAKKREREQ